MMTGERQPPDLVRVATPSAPKPKRTWREEVANTRERAEQYRLNWMRLLAHADMREASELAMEAEYGR